MRRGEQANLVGRGEDLEIEVVSPMQRRSGDGVEDTW